MMLVVAMASFATLPLLTVGCVANEPQAPTRGTVVSGPPPAPVAEGSTQPPAPTTDATWVAGYWHWTGAQYTWVPGHWETPPRGARWTAPRYSSRDGAYFYESGRWEPGPAGQPTGPMLPVSPASPTSMAADPNARPNGGNASAKALR